jgi:transcriptional regulator with XRE-family HTH domain
MSPQRGRPVGLLINPEAARYVLGDRTQASIARQSGVSAPHLSEILSGSKGANRDTAEKIADALDVHPGVLFPELVQFTTAIRYFTAPEDDS